MTKPQFERLLAFLSLSLTPDEMKVGILSVYFIPTIVALFAAVVGGAEV